MVRFLHLGTQRFLLQPRLIKSDSQRAGVTNLFAAIYSSFLVLSLFHPTTALANDQDQDLEIALTLADIMRNARLEIASQQPLINDPTLGDKGLDGEVILANVIKRLEDGGLNTQDLTSSTLPGNRLFKEQLASIVEIADENQELINRKGLGFKGFVPAVFTQLVNERFGEKVRGDATIKVTAPLHLVRNRKARPDGWEQEVIESRFSTPEWEKGRLFSEVSEANGSEVFRVMVPEYYKDACLACHGSPKGELDITGYPKEGGELGELGGAISILLSR